MIPYFSANAVISQNAINQLVYLCNNPDYPGIQFVDQAGLELTEIRLPLPHECSD